ncbi:hypothetical protein BD410DRAFT_791575 [Rickenella mellea]|uniref:Crinkler effector protein N-terminal domain-containing protein n=1 Tax=Rickenella mellea TaxID=50990 RepID=A0A4Y7PWZ8_9AGAM|nr:hypothetical protein BD410DRAFT_791575 [Rickenella mellea]
MSGAKLWLWCLIWPDDKPNDHMEHVEIDDDDTVTALRVLIKERYANRLRDFDASDIVLWKCSIPADGNLQETLETVRFDATDVRLKRLPPTSEISGHFGTDLPCTTIHILVEIPEHENTVSLAPLPNLLNLRQQYNAKIPEAPHSTLGYPATFWKIQKTDTQKIVWSRPPEADATIPVTLYHRIFRQFVDDCKNHQPTDKDNKLVRELTAAMSQFFPNKDARAAELRDILKDNGIQCTTPIISSKDQIFYVDGAIESKNHLTAILYYITTVWQGDVS